MGVTSKVELFHHRRQGSSPQSRRLCGLVCLSRTSARGEKGDCVKEGGAEEGERERERALAVRLRNNSGMGAARKA